MKISKGDIVVAVMQNPREKVLGILHKISDSGLFLRGIDLEYFDEWTRAIKNGETYLPMQELFLPMWRVERVSRDESSAGLPSMAEQFEQRTGIRFEEFERWDGGAD